MLRKTLISLLLPLCFTLTVQGRVLKHTFTVSYISGAPDGVFVDHIIGINGHFPGPTIEGEVGDTLEVTVINNLQDGENVTLHWHGFHQFGSPFSDGPSMITQCPLKMGSKQVYSFLLEDAGTFWYHSHTKSQYTAGLWGIIIVRRVPEVYKYDEEILITFNDWYHKSFLENEHWYVDPKSVGQPPFPDSVLMNGMGRYPCNAADAKGLQCSASKQLRSHYKVLPGKRYRIRAVSTSGFPAFNFSIDGHRLETIEVDGVDLKNLVVADVALIDAGQRYSFILDTRHSSHPPGSSFLIRATARTDIMPTTDRNINEYPEILKNERFRSATAVLEYVSSRQLEDGRIISEDQAHFAYNNYNPVKDYTRLTMLNERLLAPYHHYEFPEENLVATRITTSITYGRLADGIYQISFNNTPFMPPTDGLPLLARMIQGDDTIFSDPNLNVYEVKFGTGVEVVINNPNTGIHPLHLHGHHFWVVNLGQTGDGSYNPAKHRHNAIRRYRRDTITIPKNSYVVLRWMGDNPGFWTFHCHIDWHMVAGMGINFAEGIAEAREQIRIPDSVTRICEEHVFTEDTNAEEDDDNDGNDNDNANDNNGDENDDDNGNDNDDENKKNENDDGNNDNSNDNDEDNENQNSEDSD